MAELLKRIIVAQVSNVYISDIAVSLRKKGDAVDLLKLTDQKGRLFPVEKIAASKDLDDAIASGSVKLFDENGTELSGIEAQKATNLSTLRDSGAGGGGGAPDPHATTHIQAGTDEVDGDQIDIDYTPSNYSPDTSPAEVDDVDQLSAHLAGIDNALAGAVSGDFFKGVTIERPNASEDISFFFTDDAITVVQLVVVLVPAGGPTPNLTWTLRFDTDRSAAGTEIIVGGTTTSSQTTGDVITTFSNANIPANSFVWFETTAKTGNIDNFNITIRYNET